MIDLITPFLTAVPPRALPPYQKFLKEQKVFIAERYHRQFEAAGYESPGVRLLRYILQFIDYDYLDRQVNNFDRYSYHIRFIRRDLMNIFDRCQRGRGYYNLFIRKGQYLTEEFLFPIEDVNSLINLPMYTDSWEVWKRVRPLRLWTHDSYEFTTHLLQDQVKFFSLPPSYAVELLDVVALVFKYYLWNKYQRANEPAKELAEFTPQQLFIHKYVLCDWVWDLSNIWLMNWSAKFLQVESLEEIKHYDRDSFQIESQWGRVTTNISTGFEYLWKLIKDTRGNFKPDTLLNSQVLYGGSIRDRCLLASSQLTLPTHMRYEYLRWIRDRDLLNYFLSVWETHSDLPNYKVIIRNLARDIERVIRRRPWNNCHSLTLQTTVENEIRRFSDRVQKAQQFLR